MVRNVSLSEKEYVGLLGIIDEFSDHYEKVVREKARIFELRHYEGETARVGFYVNMGEHGFIVRPYYMVPRTIAYLDLMLGDGDDKTEGYRRAIALLYKYLNHIPRHIVGFREEEYDSVSGLSLERMLESRPATVVEETDAVNSRLLYDLGFDHYLSFIVMDISTPIADLDKMLPDFNFAVTWDFYHGMRTWEQASRLVDVLNSFDKVVTYGGNRFDLRVLEKYNNPGSIRILDRRSVDLNKVVYNTFQMNNVRSYSNRYRNLGVILKPDSKSSDKGKLSLDKVARATLNYGALKKDGRPVGDVYRCCERDVELTRDLFFHMLEHSVFSYYENGEETKLYVRDRLDNMMRR